MNKRKYLKVLVLSLLVHGVCFAGNDGNGGNGNGDKPCPENGGNNGCISFQFGTGPMKNHIEAPSGKVGMLSDYPSPTHSTPQALKVVTGTFGILKYENRELQLQDNLGNQMFFAFPEGDDTGYPQENLATRKIRMKMVDANGNPVTDNPAYFDYYSYEGLERARFSGDLNSPDYLQMLEYRTEEGRVEYVADYGIDFVYEDDVIRQAKAPTRMLDIITINPYKYEVRYYDIQDVSETKDANGLYYVLNGAQPFETWVIENPDGETAYNKLNISRHVGGTIRTMAFEYIETQKMWRSTKDAGLTFEESTLIWNESETAYTRSESARSAGEEPVYKEIKRVNEKPWGRAIYEEEKVVSLSPYTSQISSFTYYEDSSQTGKYTQKHTAQNFDGTWEVYDFDSKGRQTLKIESWLDVPMTTDASLAKATYYEYVPLDAADVPEENDSRPRTVTEKILGIVTKKTYHVYKLDANNAQVHIMEECVSQSAAYGDSTNLRTTETYYGPNDGALLNGRLKTIEYPDGRMDTYEYELGTLSMDYTTPGNSSFTVDSSGLDWRVSVTHGTAANPLGIANKSTKEVTVKDEYSNVALKETYVYSGGSTPYERIQWTVGKFDVYGHKTETYYSDGTQESGYWGTGCCGKDSGSDRQGIETAYTYDLNGRLETATKKKVDGVTDGITVTSTYDASGRMLAYDRTGGALSITSATQYDMTGRRISGTDEQNLTTTIAYNDASRTETRTLPSGATRILTKYADGRDKSIMGTAEVHQYYEYGVASDGKQWTKVYTGSDGSSSARWIETKTDLVGRMVFEERPSPNPLANIRLEQCYNLAGRLWKTEESVVYPGGGSSMLTSRKVYKNDAMGNLNFECLDVDYSIASETDGLVFSSMDRITEYDTGYSKEGDGYWYQQGVTKTYPTDNSDTALSLIVQKKQLTGLGSDAGTLGVLTSKTIHTDVHGKDTDSSSYIHRGNKTLTHVIDVPASSQDSTTVLENGLKISSTTSAGVVWNYTYDDVERLSTESSSSDADGDGTDDRTVSSTYGYNANNQLQWVRNAANNHMDYTYYQDSGLKHTESKQAEVDGSVQTVTTTYTYHDSGQVKKVVGGQYPVEYGYDDYGQLVTLKTWRDDTGSPDTTTWIYDDATGLLLEKQHADGKGPVYTYHDDGRLDSRTWERTYNGTDQIVTSYSYHDTGELNTITYNDGTPDITFANLSRRGQPRSVTDAQGTRTLTFTVAGQLDAETIDGKTLDRTFGMYGRPAGYSLTGTTPSQSVVYGYESATAGKGRFDTVTSTIGSETDVFTYDWMDGADLLQGYSAPLDSGNLEIAYTYETSRDHKTVVNNKANNALVSNYLYTYDESGLRTSRTDTLGTNPDVANAFKYNERGEVTDADMDGASGYEYGYAYDDIGNRLSTTQPGTPSSTTYVPDLLNRYDTVGGTDYQYDLDGNLTSDGKWSYEWNGENRLVKMETLRGSGFQAGDLRLKFAYDYMGRRFKKETMEYNASSEDFELQSTTWFFYDGWNMIHEQTTDSQTQAATTKSHVWGLDLTRTLQGAGGVGGLLATILSDGADAVYYPVADANGNITGYVDESGTVVASYGYDAFGRKIASSGTMAADFNFRFSSKYEDAETGLNYYGFRYYSAGIGRWLNRDPIEEAGGLNIYSMALNSPLLYFDKDGRSFGSIITNPIWDFIFPPSVGNTGWVPAGCDDGETIEIVDADTGCCIAVVTTFMCWDGYVPEYGSPAPRPVIVESACP